MLIATIRNAGQLECYHLENQYASFFYHMHKMIVKIEVITILLPVENTTDAQYSISGII